MRGNGFCGFNSLAYCLTGNQDSYEDIINDCANVFVNVPDLFRLRTNFGSRLNSSLTVNDYVNYMRSSVDRVRRGLSVDSDAWCEDAHFAAIAVLYDIAIFNYSTTAEQWYSFNENATNGYVCLLSSPGHTDVLHGFLEDSPPAVPPSVMSQAVSRESMNWPADASFVLQRQFSFRFVWNWPFDFGGVEVLNRALVIASQPVQLVSADERLQPPKETVFSCSFAECGFSSSNARALQMHRIRCHSGKIGKGKGKKCTAVRVSSGKVPDPENDFGRGVTSPQPAQAVTAERQTRCSSKKGYYCDVAGCSWGPVWTLAALAKHNEEHSDGTARLSAARLERTTEIVHATQKRHTERPTTNCNTEFAVRRSSRIASRQNETKQAARKTVTPKKSVSRRKKRVHDKRPQDQNASNENVDITDSADRKYPKATPKSLQTSRQRNIGSAAEFFCGRFTNISKVASTEEICTQNGSNEEKLYSTEIAQAG